MRRLLPALLLLTTAWSLAGPAPAADDDRPERHIEVVQVEGFIDPVVTDLIVTTLDKAPGNGATVVILQIDSDGALDTDPARVLEAVRQSPVPVVAWVGPARSAARGLAAQLVTGASLGGVSPGSTLGSFRGQEAVDAEIADFLSPTLGDVVVTVNGQTVQTPAGEVELSTTRVVQTEDGPRQTANQQVRFRKLSALQGVQHSLTSPAIAYLLLVAGLALLVFEFFTVGIGLASLAGAACLAGACFGFSHLPVAPWAVALVVVSAFGFAVDVQAGRRGFWTGVGVAGLLAGSLGLYEGSPRLDLAWWQAALGVGGQTLFMRFGMTVAVRNRFSLPTVGREAMIGEAGEARTDLDPEGVVLVRGAPWRARTYPGRPVQRGGAVRVVAVDQLVLEVEPDGRDSAAQSS